MKKPNFYVDLDEDNENDPEENDDDDDVIFISKSNIPTSKPYNYYVSKNNINDISDIRKDTSSTYYKLNRFNKNENNTSPRLRQKFQATPGVSKSYKRISTPLPKWINISAKNKYSNLNGSPKSVYANTQSALTEVFNLDEKRNYQELIRKSAAITKPTVLYRPSNSINLVEDSASLRSTQRSQKKSLDELKLVERGIALEKDLISTKEYDPITVASLNSDSDVEEVPSEKSSSSVRIQPVNTLRDLNSDKAVVNNKWLENLDSKYKKKRQETQSKLTDVRLESDIISKLNAEQNLALIQHKLKHVLSIPESLIEEVPAAVELPELTSEQEKLINRALGPGPAGQLLIEKFNLRIHRYVNISF